MIKSWKDLVYAVAEMRQLQRDPKTPRIPDKLFRRIKLEAEVDACLIEKIAVWEPQKNLFEEKTNGKT